MPHPTSIADATPQGAPRMGVGALASPGYGVFILVTTVLALINWALIILPLRFGVDIRGLLWVMELFLTGILLIDFSLHLHQSRPRRSGISRIRHPRHPCPVRQEPRAVRCF